MAEVAMPTLVGESFSPWTKKARWALELCEQPYHYREYTPTLSEPGLRWRMRQWTGRVSVPVLFVGDRIYRGSWAIAGFANDCTAESRLGDMTVIKPWDDISEAALAEGRTRVVRSVLGDDQALEEALPALIPGWLRPSMRLLARNAGNRLDQKYAHLVSPGALPRALKQIRNELAAVDGDYLLGQFSYADVTMAVVLEVISPIARTDPPLGPATLCCWHDPDLANEYQDLLAWRNRLAANDATSFSQFRGQ